MRLLEKIANNYYRYYDRLNPSENVNLELFIDKIDGENQDTRVIMTGEFTIAGESRDEFNKALGELIDKYRI